MRNRNYKILGVALSGLVVVVFVLIWAYGPNRDVSPADASNTASIAAAATPKPNPFHSLSLEAKSAYVWDVREKTPLFSKFETAQLPLASLTKIITVITALSYVSSDTEIVIDSIALAEEGDSGLVNGEVWKMNDLAAFTLIASSNDGARAIALNVERLTGRSFEDLMNEQAARLGLSQTYFLNTTGLDAGEAGGGAYGSARDIATLLSFGIENFPEVFEETAFAEREFVSLDSNIHKAKNTNPLAGSLTGLVASKTGFTDLAGGNLAVAIDVGPARPVIIVVLGSTQEGRFSDVASLTDATIKFLSNQ